MSEQSFESALTECLAALDAGTPVEDVLARFPAHIDALRPALGLRAALDARAVPLPPTMRVRGEQRLQAALASPAPAGGIPVLSSLLSSLPKAAVQALIALLVTGGAVGASAAVGGPNIPQAALHAVGLTNDHANDNAQHEPNGNAKGKTANATATSKAGLSSNADSDNGLKGLCNAYEKGGLGQNANENARDKATPAASPMARLEAARGNKSIAEYCRDLLSSEVGGASKAATAEAGGQGRGKGSESSGAAESTATAGQGKAPTSVPGKGR